MKATSFKFFVMWALAIGLVMSFVKCEKDLGPEETITQATIRGNGSNGYNDKKGNPATNANTKVDVCECLTANFKINILNDAEKEALTFMREEEKLARDVYYYLYEKWNYQVFNNISRAEERHMDALLCLYERSDLVDPVGDNAPGIFVNDQFTELYKTFIEKGAVSLTEALKVGATIEDVDINDLMNLTEGGTIEDEAILAVFAELTKGSRNHLRVFIRALNGMGDSYEPQFITVKQFEEIIDSDRERGSELCSGMINCDGNQGARNQGRGGNQGDCAGDGSGSGSGICNANCPGGCTGTGPSHNPHGKRGPK